MKKTKNPPQQKQPVGERLFLELLRCILLPIIFFALYLPLERYVLNPLRGVHPEPTDEDLLRRICPPGELCVYVCVYM